MSCRDPVEPPCSQEELLAMLSYNPENGELRWRTSKGSRRVAGAIAGGIHKGENRRRISINYRQYYSYTLIWYMVTGHWPRWPDEIVDHKDVYGLPRDFGDRWENLRLATCMNNQWNKTIQKNNTTGYPGLGFLQSGKPFAIIRHKNKVHYLGSFNSLEQAKRARQKAEVALFGEFQARHLNGK